MSGALDGITVIDLSRVLAGPYCTMQLGDFGAKIIKIESPFGGDEARQWGPPWAGGESAYFLAVNRNKRSMTLNLKHPEGQRILKELVHSADVVIENFKVGTLEKWDLGLQALRERHPGLITCSLTGYGQSGPAKNRPGYDFAIQAEGGLMSITGPVDGPPIKVGVAIVDIVAGLFAANAILAALHHRHKTGLGQSIDISLFDTQLAWLANVAQSYLVSGQAPDRYGNAHPNIVPYQAFQTRDGYLALAVGNDGQFQRFCEAAGCAELLEDDRFQSNPGRVEHRHTLLPRLAAILRKWNTTEWLDILTQAGVPAAPINTIPAALEHPQVAARGMLRTISHPSAGDLTLVGPPARLSKTPLEVSLAPPRLGEHTEEILRELLGLSTDQIVRLQKEQVIGPASTYGRESS